MDRLALGRLLRLLRVRRGWRLVDLAAGTGLSTAGLHRHEVGAIASLDRLERHARALDARIAYRLIGRGADLPRLQDEEHAAIVNALAASFRADADQVEVEVSYNEWGERGRIDLLARSGDRLVVAEIKTELADLQDLLGAMSVKARLAPTIARRLGWASGRVVWLLAVAATAHNRGMVRAHQALFSSFDSRWLRSGAAPSLDADRVLLWVPAKTANRRRWLAGRRRVRRPRSPGGTSA